MSSSTLIEVFGHIVFSFTRGVSEHYNPEEPEFTAESFGYDPLQSTGREWYYLPVDELIYQEYSDREVTSLAYLASSRLNIRVIDACSTEKNEDPSEEQQDEDKSMAWKRLRPSALRTVCKSMYIAASISLLTASVVGSVFMLISYLCYKTVQNCALNLVYSAVPLRVQWTITISDIVASAFLYAWFFFTLLFLFRPYQLKGMKRKLIMACCAVYCLDTLYRMALQGVGKPYYLQPSRVYQLPLYILFSASLCLQVFLIGRHFGIRSTTKVVNLICKMKVPTCFFSIAAFLISSFIYPAYNKQTKEGKLLIAVFAPLIGVVLKAISRICVQRLWNITHPGYSYALLAPLYCGSAVMFRILQADLGSLQSIAILGIVHGAAEVIERSAMVVIDHICHLIWKRTSAPWGSFRTPRRERLMADIAIMSMLFESTAIVSVNGFLYLFKFLYLENDSLLKLLQSFALHSSTTLVIEWFFSSVSLTIETRYQNMPVMAVWQKRWKRHLFVAVLNAVTMAIWTSSNLFVVVHGLFSEAKQTCKMPFT